MGLSGTGTVREGIQGVRGLPVSSIDDGTEPGPGDKLQKTRINDPQDSGKTRKSESVRLANATCKAGEYQEKN
ncbi:MAG: hypothetical protein D4R56_04745 [Deltaproteobacteria bacterium]|nr:MAG: hypothetical protein D4R56_04745 [Deltaproteobacteria bacterium]